MVGLTDAGGVVGLTGTGGGIVDVAAVEVAVNDWGVVSRCLFVWMGSGVPRVFGGGDDKGVTVIVVVVVLLLILAVMGDEWDLVVGGDVGAFLTSPISSPCVIVSNPGISS